MNDLAIFKQIMFYLKSYRYFAGMLIMTVMFAMTSIIQSIAVKYLIDAAEQKDFNNLLTTSYMLVISIVVTIIFIPFFRFMYNGRAVMTKGEMKKDAFHKIIMLPVKYFDNTHSGIIMTNVTSDIEISASLFTWRLHLAIAPFIYAIFSIIPMFALNPQISIILIVVNILLTCINLLFLKPIKEISEKIQQSLDIFNEKLFNMLSGFEIMKLFRLEKVIGSYYTEACDLYAKRSLKRIKLSAFVDSLNQFIARASSIGMVLAGVWLVRSDFVTIGTILTLINLQNSVNSSFLQAGNKIPQLQEAFVSGRRVFETMKIEPEPKCYPTECKNVSGIALSMEQVSFSYDNETNIVNEINLTIKNGQMVALVGPSGSGKSTIMKLLLGFYPPNKGNIIVNEKSFGQYTLSQIRDLISYVPQDAYLFSGTIEDNIRYGNIEATDEQIIEAAKSAYAHDFIIEQPVGYKTIIGENGITLSGGQKQRIAIARAFLKNSPIILLDEATASLDSESEKYVYEAISSLMKNKTILLIAHRLSTVENADNIYFLNDGCITEQGSHSELLKRDGLYKNLYYTQYINDNVFNNTQCKSS